VQIAAIGDGRIGVQLPRFASSGGATSHPIRKVITL
jgi:hypothetical protein